MLHFLLHGCASQTLASRQTWRLGQAPSTPNLAVCGTVSVSPQPAPAAPSRPLPCPRFTTALTGALWLTPQSRGETEQIKSSQYLVGVEGLEAGLGRAVKGAGDTESVVQNLQLRQQNRNQRRRRKGRKGRGEWGKRKK